MKITFGVFSLIYEIDLPHDKLTTFIRKYLMYIRLLLLILLGTDYSRDKLVLNFYRIYNYMTTVMLLLLCWGWEIKKILYLSPHII